MQGARSSTRRPAMMGSRRHLFIQVELAVFLVFEGVERALPAVDVPVVALDTGFVQSGGHFAAPS